MATLKDIAKEANVSVMTVSNVIHNKTNKVSAETVKKVQAIINKYNYTPNMNARSLVNNSSKLIGFLLYQNTKTDSNNIMFNNPFNTEVLSGVDQILRENDYYLLVRTVTSIKEIKNILKTWNVDGVILLGMLSSEADELRNMIQIPIVLIDTYTEESYMNVGIDDQRGMMLATDYLIKNGHKKIGFVSYSMFPSGVIEQRYLGYSKSMKNHRLPINKNIIYEYDEKKGSIKELAYKIKNNIDQITALLFTADYLAIETMESLKSIGIRIPEDISIIGFDDILIAKYITPKLTSVHQNIRQKGEEAASLIIKSLANQHSNIYKIELPIHLVIRESVKKIEIRIVKTLSKW